MRLRKRGRAEGPDEGPQDAQEPSEDVSGTVEEAAAGPRASGPWDADEIELPEDDQTRIDLGSLSVKGHAGLEVRLQVDEASQQVAAVLLVAQDGAVELRAFAASRHQDLWEEVRPQIRSEAARHGGTATEVDGPWGTALQLMVPAVAPDGTQGTQQSTVHGIAGPRWMLRATMLGRPAVDLQPDGVLEQALRDVVVRRGTEAMPPGEALPMQIPSGAHRLDGPS